eukprot:3297406-Amphidinium_carterae.2
MFPHSGEHICWGKGAEERMTNFSTGQFERASDIWRSTASQGCKCAIRLVRATNMSLPLVSTRMKIQ